MSWRHVRQIIIKSSEIGKMKVRVKSQGLRGRLWRREHFLVGHRKESCHQEHRVDVTVPCSARTVGNKLS